MRYGWIALLACAGAHATDPPPGVCDKPGVGIEEYARCARDWDRQQPHLVVTTREVTPEQCVKEADAAIAREREVGRASGFVDAALLYNEGVRKVACQRQVDARRAAAKR